MHFPPLRLALLSILVLALILAAFLGYRWYMTNQNLNAQAALFGSERTGLQTTIAELELGLREAFASRDALLRELQAERAKTGEFERTLDGIQDTVSTLEKLQYTDPELLAKYSKVYFLSEHYAPTDLARIPDMHVAPEGRVLEVHARVLPYLVEMFKEAAEDGIELRAVSAYRSFGTQATLKSNYTVAYGTGANRFSADQGYSEHQLGTTLDLSTKELGTDFTSIEGTAAYTWLTENAHRFGFVLSYPKDNAYYQYEPWHWRYVGERLARDLHEEGRHLYDLDQRTLDEYLVYLFD
ncbi:MAG TPA: M15 family metallopeptidase [Candidatus Paceibacterota bacterium]|nr:M15 family metallopeptidase [Candidatus Paceibacterota bacterium]